MYMFIPVSLTESPCLRAKVCPRKLEQHLGLIITQQYFYSCDTSFHQIMPV